MQQGRRTSWLREKLHKSVVEIVVFVNELWLAYHHPPHKSYHRPPHKGPLCPTRKGTVLMHRIVQFVNGVRPSNKRPVHQQVYFIYCTNSHVCAPFVNGHRLT